MILDFLCVYIHVFVPSCCVLIVFYITFFPRVQPFYVKSLSLMFSFFISCLTFVCLVSLNPPVYEFQLFPRCFISAPDTLLCTSSLLLLLCLVICCLSLFLLLYLYLFASIISLYPQRKLFVVPGFWCFPFYFVSLLDLTTGLLINDSL